MFKIGLTFLTLLVSVVGAVASSAPDCKNSLRIVSASSVELQPCSNTNKSVSPAYRNNGTQECVTLRDSDVVTCRPGGNCQPPAFYAPPAASMPSTVVPPLPVTASSDMSAGATVALIVCGLSALAGVFIRKRKEDDADEKAEAEKAENEKKYRERAVKISASPHVANA